MNVRKKFVFGLKPSKGVFWAVLAIFSNDSFAQSSYGQSAFNRGSAQRAQSLNHYSFKAEKRNSLIGEVVVNRPVTIEARNGTSIVMGSTLINQGNMVANGTEVTSAQIEVHCANGSRIIIYGNRAINTGRISAIGKQATAAQIVTKCKTGNKNVIRSMSNDFQNNGQITTQNR